MKDGTRRADIKPGMLVNIVLKKDQRTGVLTFGRVKDILTKSPIHQQKGSNLLEVLMK